MFKNIDGGFNVVDAIEPITLIIPKSRIELGYIVPPSNCIMKNYCTACRLESKQGCCFYRLQNGQMSSTCFFCNSISDCDQIIQTGIIPVKTNIMKNNNKAKTIEVKEEIKYIPRIDSRTLISIQSQLVAIKMEKVQIIAISIGELISISKEQYGLLKEEFLFPLHTLINFNGKILLTTNFNDKLCQFYLDNHSIFINILQTLQPDAVFSPDANFQYNLPDFIHQIQYNRICELSDYIIEAKIPLIGLIVPLPRFLKQHIEFFLAKGIKTIGIPVLELEKYRKTKPVYLKFLRLLNSELAMIKRYTSFTLIGISSSPNGILDCDYYLSKSWLFAKNSGANNKIHRKNQQNKLKRLIQLANKRNAKETMSQRTLNQFIGGD